MTFMQDNSNFSGQIILIGTVVCEGFNKQVAKGSRCAMISVVDCDTLAINGELEQYMLDDGLNAGMLLDETLGQNGWSDIKVRNALPIAPTDKGWEPELEALIKTAHDIGIAHMVFEPDCEKPHLIH